MREQVTFNYTPQMPSRDEIDIDQVVFEYDEDDDELLVHLFGKPLPAISVVIGPYEYFRIDPETEQIVGFYVEHFLARAVFEDPALLSMASLAGVGESKLEKIRRQLPETRMKESAIRKIFSPHQNESPPAVSA